MLYASHIFVICRRGLPESYGVSRGYCQESFTGVVSLKHIEQHPPGILLTFPIALLNTLTEYAPPSRDTLPTPLFEYPAAEVVFLSRIAQIN